MSEQVVRHQGVDVEVTDSYEDCFIREKTAIRLTFVLPNEVFTNVDELASYINPVIEAAKKAAADAAGKYPR